MPGLAKASGPDAAKIASLLGQLHSDDEWHATIEVFAAVAARVRVTAPDFLAAHMGGPGTTLFEGAQGVLLDEDWGFHPYTTWSRTTPANARALIAETGLPVPTTVLGLTRAYQTRHGAGPFPTESETLTRTLDEPHNPTNAWQGPFRAGWLDLALLRYAIQVSGPLDGLVMTHLDRIPELPEGKVGVGYAIDGAAWSLIPENPGCLEQREADGKTLASATVRYESLPSDANVYAATVAEWLGLPLWGTSSGPTAREKWFVL